MVRFTDQLEHLYHGTPQRDHRGINGRIFREGRDNSNRAAEFETKNKDLPRFSGILQRRRTRFLQDDRECGHCKRHFIRKRNHVKNALFGI